MSDLFISYSRQDQPFALQLCDALGAYGLDVWVDKDDIHAGVKWSTAIQEGLKTSAVMLVILSPASMGSRNVEDEWQFFLDKNKPVIPVLYKPAEIHFQLNRLQYIDFHSQPFETAFKQLYSELRRNGVSLPALPEGDVDLPTTRHGPVERRTMSLGGIFQNRSCQVTLTMATVASMLIVAGLFSVLNRPIGLVENNATLTSQAIALAGTNTFPATQPADVSFQLTTTALAQQALTALPEATATGTSTPSPTPLPTVTRLALTTLVPLSSATPETWCTVRVSTDSAPVYSGTNTGFRPLARLETGTILRVEAIVRADDRERTLWYRVPFSDTRSGWIEAEHVTEYRSRCEE
jgi:hypothetical protein